MVSLLCLRLHQARSSQIRFHKLSIVSSQLSRGFSHLPKAMGSAYENDGHEFFRYTSGRWLWDEEAQLRARYRRFNVLELQNAAINVLGARNCSKMSKIGEGNFNKIFKLTMDDQSVIIARIPHPNAGPPTVTTASEVATIDFARSVLGIPVPKVLGYSADAANPVGSEYILMEEAKGVQLSSIWNNLEIDDQAIILKSLMEIDAKFLAISLDRFGAIFYAKDMPNYDPAEIRGQVSAAVKKDVRRRFVVGPTVEREFWEDERTQIALDRGPWTSASAYVEAIAQREIQWLERCAKAKVPPVPLPTSDAQKSPKAHIELLQKYLGVVGKLLPREEDLLLPTLWHRDLHRGNVFVHEGQVSSIIDWQSVWVGPRNLRARIPQLVDYNGEIQTKLPENFKDLESEEKNQVREAVCRSILLHIYETSTAKRNPSLYKVMRYPNGKTLEQLIEFAHNPWDGDILPFREVLIRIQRDWHLIDETSSCPYHFSSEEIAQHRIDGKGFNENADFWDNLEGRVHRSGYTSHADFQDAAAYFSELRRVGLETLVGDERKTFELQTRWMIENSDGNR
ncbi:kinase-like domain-containing protein [Phaeosphaeria sp. MPI-PUGE-AT-0046c]|nr:kinase-like domain-containing protein [Phaeosphaeria sp. MPI-PUGE-AT-0046c]